jgi:F-type H+-transporting ATPase subunit gamma
MPSLKEVRNRITSVNSTRQITSAMKMVSAAKLKKAQDTIVELRPYAEKLTDILGNLSGNLESMEGNFADEREVKKVLLVAYTSNRGLCGAFNAQIIRRVRRAIEETDANIDVEVFSIGKKAYDFFRKTPYAEKGLSMADAGNHLYDNIDFSNTAGIAEKVMNAFMDGTYDQVVLVYNKFKNAASQEVMFEQMLPIVPPSETGNDTEYIFEPSKEEILEELIPKALKTQMHKALLDSNASEHGARMTAMHKATDNATELLKELKLTYNKARQAAITKEILEITSGAEALNG